MSRALHTNARLIDPASGLDQTGAILVENGKIAAVGSLPAIGEVSEETEIVDHGGATLAPGLVDMRVLLGEPGEEQKETVKSGARAAVAGGVTSFVCLPNTTPVIDNVAALQFIARRGRDVKLAKIHAYGATTVGTEGERITEMGLLAHAGAVGFTDGTRAVASAKTMRRALSYAKTFDKLVIQHPEEPTLAEGGVMNAGELATRLGLSGVPRAAEIIMIERDLRLVELTGARLHFAHITTSESVRLVRQAKERGLPVTCDTAPHYFTLTEGEVGDYRTFAKVSPPLRNEADRWAVMDGLADGTIDAIVSDHAPQDQDHKRLPFAQASFGVVGLETLLPLALELYHEGAMSLADVLATVTSKPASILGLPVGRLEVGAPADLVAIDVDTPWTIDPDSFKSKSKNSLFEDRSVRGRAVRTFVDGRLVWSLEESR